MRDNVLHSIGSAWVSQNKRRAIFSSINLGRVHYCSTGPRNIVTQPGIVCESEREQKICTYANISLESTGNFLKGDCNILKRYCITLYFLLYLEVKIKFLPSRECRSDIVEYSCMQCGPPINHVNI